MVEKDNKYTEMQLKQYNDEAEHWNLNNRSPVIGNWDQNNHIEDKELLFTGINTLESVGLDFGCGPGRNLVRFHRDFQRLDGVDISPICLEKAKLHLQGEGIESENIQLFLCNGIDLGEIADNSYNVILSTITLQHICVYEIRLNYLKEFFRVLKTGGVFTAQMGFGKRAGGHNYFENYYDAEGTNGWHDVMIDDPQQLKDDLISVGFKTFQYSIEPCKGGDAHDNWIYFRASKV